MKKFFTLLFLSACILNAVCNPVYGPVVKDCQGNEYPTVWIGKQLWMAENLRCTKYDTKSERAGVLLSTSENSTSQAYYTDIRDYPGRNGNSLTEQQRMHLGLLYNWAATVGVANGASQTTQFSGYRQGICPNGWHIPSMDEWNELVDYVEVTDGYGSNTAAAHLKATDGWMTQNTCFDTYGFSALPAGVALGETNNNNNLGVDTEFFTITLSSGSGVYTRALNSNIDRVIGNDWAGKYYALSVRCIKDTNVTYKITFVNYNGVELQSSEVDYGETPTYTGATPTKPADSEYTNTFTGWDNEIEPVTEDKTYTAVFKSVSKGTISDICGNAYHYVKIGNQVWLAENMKCNKYDTKSERAGVLLTTSNVKTNAPYYKDGREVVTNYSENITTDQRQRLGLLYSWAAVVGLVDEAEALSQISSFDGNRQGICPNGWHVPSLTEWDALKSFIENTDGKGERMAAKHLKSISGWYGEGSGLDSYGFDVLPAGSSDGFRFGDGTCGNYATFWTATPTSKDKAFGRNIYSYNNIYEYESEKHFAQSVRCVQNKGVKIRFLNYDGSELQSSEVAYGAMPVYTGATPAKLSDSENYKYVFSGWDSEIVPVTEDKAYTATFIQSPVYKDGVLNGEFSVGEDKKIHFSQGNLQYNAARGIHQCADGSSQRGTWRFADNQLDYVGDDNYKASSSYDGWIDMFIWASSGWNGTGSIYNQPYSSATKYTDYIVNGYNGSLLKENRYADWGVYNAIENGGGKPDMWRCPTIQEWDYLFYKRDNAKLLYATAMVDTIRGLILLPDNWQCPNGVVFVNSIKQFEDNIYTLSEWQMMENNGAVFLPANGFYYGHTGKISAYGKGCWYVSSNTLKGDTNPSMVSQAMVRLTPDSLNLYADHWLGSRRAVRLVKDVKNSAGSEETEQESVSTVVTSVSVEFSWQAEIDAVKYVISVYLNGNPFCSVTFNSDGNVLKMEFFGIPSLRSAELNDALLISNSYRFSMSGLTENTEYDYVLEALDESDTVIKKYEGVFMTLGGIDSVEENNSDVNPKLSQIISVDNRKISIAGIDASDIRIFNTAGKQVSNPVPNAGVYVVTVGGEAVKVVVR